ncbi:MAG: VWA domain-containing protein [Labilithrix sp.]|nr:VWA domain-containing protein [Labilithrix sp.]
MSPSRPLRHVFRGAVVFGVLAAAASCGSRTGLFGPEPPDPVPDASLDVIVPRDALADVRDDSPIDATIDVIEEPVGCVPGKFTFTLATAQLMFVLDRSGSMDFLLTSNDPALPGQTSRWRALESSLSQTITPFTNQIAMGARFYPAANASGNDAVLACIQDPASGAISPALNNAAKILDVFRKTEPIGGTPTATALQLAAQEVSSSRAVARAMVIATDGAPNCNGSLDRSTCTCTSTIPNGCRTATNGASNCLDDARTLQTITSIVSNRRIPVYVIGIGVTASFASTLDAMAVAGGRPRTGSPKYYAAGTPADLTAAFTVVRDSVANCSYITPSSPQDPNAISVEIGGATIARDPDHLDGWDWIDQEYGHLQLFGAACALASATNVSGTVTCDPPDE